MKDKRIGVAVIGIQGFGRTYMDFFKTQSDVKVVAICDINTQAASKLAAQYDIPCVVSDYKDILKYDEVDAVFIATPHYLHYTMTMEALKSGKHVFCEKPLAITSKEAWEMAKASRTYGRILTCHYNRRQSTAVKLLRDLVEKGTLGTIYQANVKWMARWTGFMFDSSTSWRVSKEKAGGGILIGRGSHMLDAIWYVLGKPVIKSVYAVTTSKLTGFEVDDYSFVILKLANDATIHIECSYMAHIPAYEQKIEYELFGTKAGAICSNVDNNDSIYVGYCRFPKNEWVDLTDTIDISAYENMWPKSIIEDFLEAIRNGSEPFVTAEDAAYVTQLLEAAYKSSENGKEISV